MSYTPRNPNGQAAMAASEPVVIASDQSAVPVSGTVTANLGATDNAVLDAIEADTSSLSDATQTMSTGGTTWAVTKGIAVGTYDGSNMVPLRANNNGELVVNIDSIAAGTTNIGDVDVLTMPGTGVEDAAETVGGTLLMAGTVRRDTAASSAGTTGDNATLNTDSLGRLWVSGAAVEDDPETAGGTVIMAGTVRRDTAASSAGTSGDNATLNTDSLGRLWISGAAVEDAAETAGGILLMSGSVRRDTAASSAGTTGDNATINTDSVGALWTRSTGELSDDAAFTPATSRVMPNGYFADETATDSVDEGDVGAARMTLDRKQIVTTYAHSAGGATPYKLVSAASTNATSVKASAGTLYMVTASNVNAAARYLKLYNKASAPTVGTDIPAFTFIIPGNTAGAGTNIPIPNVGINFSTGIAFALTTEATDAGSTGVAASEIVVNLAYV